jgi:hypothetical protein
VSGNRWGFEINRVLGFFLTCSGGIRQVRGFTVPTEYEHGFRSDKRKTYQGELYSTTNKHIDFLSISRPYLFRKTAKERRILQL